MQSYGMLWQSWPGAFNSIFEWSDIKALMSCRLVALDKCLGVWPIAIGEIPRRILCKAMAIATRDDIKDLCEVDQLCSGLKGGIEGAVHTMRELFEEHHADGWGLLIVDARNAFNSLNRAAAIWNSRIQWPCCSRFLFHTYRGYVTLVLQDKKKTEFLLSKEGTGQGDPLSMLMSAAAIMRLIKSLSNHFNWIQNWYADDSSCIAKLTYLRDWFDKLCEHGPKYGYYPEVDKCIVIVNSNHETKARSAFEHLGVKVVKGYRFLGGFLADQSFYTEEDYGIDEQCCQTVQSG